MRWQDTTAFQMRERCSTHEEDYCLISKYLKDWLSAGSWPLVSNPSTTACPTAVSAKESP